MADASTKVAIAGHAGIGHTHCPGGLIQDDSAGFAVVAAIVGEVLEADTHVATVEASPDSNTIRVTTAGGGVGEASPRRGITPSEARLIQNVTGGDALLCQAVAIETLGRMYGQGVLETPAALEAALANSVIDTFHKKAPERFYITKEDLPTNSGLIGGMLADLGGVRAAVLATVNESTGGLGPNEDLEGNVALGSKRALMEKLGMLKCPTIVVEGKAYVPALCDGLKQTTFLVRFHEDVDNVVVAKALYEAANDLGYPVVIVDDAFPRNKGALRRRTIEVAEKISRAAERLEKAEKGTEKVLAVAELARLVSEEAGGVSFMTDALFDVVRQTGLIPGTSAVLSMLVTREYLDHWKIPVVEADDIESMKHIVHGAIPRIAAHIDEADAVLERLYEDTAPLESFVRPV